MQDGIIKVESTRLKLTPTHPWGGLALGTGGLWAGSSLAPPRPPGGLPTSLLPLLHHMAGVQVPRVCVSVTTAFLTQFPGRSGTESGGEPPGPAVRGPWLLKCLPTKCPGLGEAPRR